MPYPIDREPEISTTLDLLMKQVGWLTLDMQYSQSDAEPMPEDEQKEFDARLTELATFQRHCLTIKAGLWNGMPIALAD